MSRGHVVWVQYEPGEPWVACERPWLRGKQLPPLTEAQAAKEVRECKANGVRAKALPEGVDANAVEKAS